MKLITNTSSVTNLLIEPIDNQYLKSLIHMLQILLFFNNWGLMHTLYK